MFLTDFQSDLHMPSLLMGSPVDTTGAGDAFFGGFLAGWIRGYSLERCAILGSAQAAGVIAQKGANAGAGNMDAARALAKASGYILP